MNPPLSSLLSQAGLDTVAAVEATSELAAAQSAFLVAFCGHCPVAAFFAADSVV